MARRWSGAGLPPGLFFRGQSRPVGGSIAQFPADHLRAFYEVERRYSSPMRWSKPDASLDLTMPPGDYFLRLQLHPFRDLTRLWEQGFAINFNSHPLPPSAFHIGGKGRFLVCRLPAAWVK